MVLKPEVVKAFKTLGLSPDVDEPVASRTYKKLALIHHPDRNHGDKNATQRFQEIGAAWEVCQRHYERPAWSQVPYLHRHESNGGMEYSSDDDVPLYANAEEAANFFRFMFEEMMSDRYSRARGQRFRHERSAPSRGGVFKFSSGVFQQADSKVRQAREKAEYEKRVRELECEIEADRREAERLARDKMRAKDRMASGQTRAFQAGRAGKGAEMKSVIEEFGLDVNAPEKLPPHGKDQQQQKRNTDAVVHYETMLHVAAGFCNGELVTFLLGRGADPTALNKDQLTPFHFAILSGNTNVASFFLARRTTKNAEGCHPSKSAPDGRTPLQLAVASSSADTVRLVLKDATVHDVERCWGHDVELCAEEAKEEIKSLLLTKKGFLPPAVAVESGKMPLSKKALRKIAETEKAEREKEEKAKRVAEERARAIENSRKKQERAQRRAHREAVRQEEEAARRSEDGRQKEEEEERRREGEERRREEEERQRRGEEERQREEEERQRREVAERMRREEEGRRKREEEEGQKREEEEKQKREEEEKQKREEEEKQKREEEEGQKKRRGEVREQKKNRRKEKQKEVETARPNAAGGLPGKIKEDESHKVKADAEIARTQGAKKASAATIEDEQQKEKAPAKQKSKKTAAERRAERDKAKTEREERAKAEEERQRAEEVRLIEENRMLEERRAQEQRVIEETAAKAKEEAKMKQKAEQSARDKARHKRLLEERAKEKASKVIEPTIDVVRPPAIEELASRQTRQRKAKTDRFRDEGKNNAAIVGEASLNLHTAHLLPPNGSVRSPAASSSPPHAIVVPPLNDRIVTPHAKLFPNMPLSPPMTPESPQTCEIPVDLFSDPHPARTYVLDSGLMTPLASSKVMGDDAREFGVGLDGRGRGQGRGRERGRGRRGRGVRDDVDGERGDGSDEGVRQRGRTRRRRGGFGVRVDQ